jgi:hypothetical protein
MVPLLVLAALLVLATLAPRLPLLHLLPKVGAPKVVAYISYEPVPNFPGDLVLRVGFRNEGPRRVEHTTINVLVPAPVGIRASNHAGEDRLHGSDMPTTEIDGKPWEFWGETDVGLAVGSTILHYRLSIPEPGQYPVRVTFHSDDLYGTRDRVLEDTVVRAPS